jgi:hypothetical protein
LRLGPSPHPTRLLSLDDPSRYAVLPRLGFRPAISPNSGDQPERIGTLVAHPWSENITLFEGNTLAQDETENVVDRLAPIAQDVERLVDLHAELLRSELRESAAQIRPALTSLGVGAGFAAAAGLLGTLAIVHGLQRTTRLPLWGCYGLVGGLLGAAGAGLMGSGARQFSGVNFIPRQTIATLKEDLKWVSGKTK